MVPTSNMYSKENRIFLLGYIFSGLEEQSASRLATSKGQNLAEAPVIAIPSK